MKVLVASNHEYFQIVRDILRDTAEVIISSSQLESILEKERDADIIALNRVPRNLSNPPLGLR